MSAVVADQAGRKHGLAALRRLLRADLGFHGVDGRYSTHGWHPFPAKFPPQLPRFFIEALSEPGETVLDPMLGSGTTLVEAQLLGRRAVGCDIDPLARMIAAAKLTPVDPIHALGSGQQVLDEARLDYECRQVDLAAQLERRFDAKTGKFVDYWFPKQQQLELQALSNRIASVTANSVRRFLQVVLSSSIIAKSGGVSLARDLAHTRPHRVLDKRPKSAFVEFDRRLRSNAARIPEGGTIGFPQVLGASADSTGLASESVDLIVTSPPYANNAIDYMRAHKFSLVWLGWKIEDLAGLRRRYLGHDAMGPNRYPELPGQCETTLSRLARVDGRKAAVLRRYFGEMADVLREMRRVLRSGRATVIVVGTSMLRGIDVETPKGLTAIGESVGFRVVGVGVRRLDRDKRMMPARWGGKRQSQIEQRMHEEHVIGLIKQ